LLLALAITWNCPGQRAVGSKNVFEIGSVGHGGAGW
jgi:hypothetical protein